MALKKKPATSTFDKFNTVLAEFLNHLQDIADDVEIQQQAIQETVNAIEDLQGCLTTLEEYDI